MCRCASEVIPTCRKRLRYSFQTSSGCSVATVATTSLDEAMRAETSRRIVMSPSLSSRPPMITSEPLLDPGRAGSISRCRSAWPLAIFFAAARLLAAAGAALFPLLRLAIEHDLPVGILQEGGGFVDLSVSHQHAAARHDVLRAMRTGVKRDDIRVAAGLQLSFGRELQDLGGVAGRDRQDRFKGPAGVDAGGDLFQQVVRAAAAGVGRYREPVQVPAGLDEPVEIARQPAFGGIDVHERTAATERCGFGQQ